MVSTYVAKGSLWRAVGDNIIFFQFNRLQNPQIEGHFPHDCQHYLSHKKFILGRQTNYLIVVSSKLQWIQKWLTKYMCPKKRWLCLEANNSSFEAPVRKCKTIFEFLRFSDFIWAHGTLRKSHILRNPKITHMSQYIIPN